MPRPTRAGRTCVDGSTHPLTLVVRRALWRASLVDGNVSYAFDVNRIIAELASSCDLVLVFLDPIVCAFRQAVCAPLCAFAAV